MNKGFKENEKNLHLLKNVHRADNFTSRLFGYMFQKEPRYEAILFKPCNSIHTFFMRFSIDVLFLNDEFIVVKKVNAMSAGKAIMPVKGANMVLEAPKGELSHINVGDRLTIE